MADKSRGRSRAPLRERKMRLITLDWGCRSWAFVASPKLRMGRPCECSEHGLRRFVAVERRPYAEGLTGGMVARKRRGPPCS